MHVDKKDCDRSTVCSWSPEPAKLNSAFSRVARRNLPTAPPSWALSQDILRRWERAAREQSFMCNQAAGLSRCLTRVQDSMSTQLRSLHVDKGKGKSSDRMQQAVDELEYLVTFNWSISQAMARTIAFPVGTDRPAKRQKKSFGMHAYWPASPGVHSLGVASCTCFLASARDVIGSFFVWRESCASEYFQCLNFVKFSGYLRSFLILLIAK